MVATNNNYQTVLKVKIYNRLMISADTTLGDSLKKLGDAVTRVMRRICSRKTFDNLESFLKEVESSKTDIDCVEIKCDRIDGSEDYQTIYTAHLKNGCTLHRGEISSVEEYRDALYQSDGDFQENIEEAIMNHAFQSLQEVANEPVKIVKVNYFLNEVPQRVENAQ